MRDFVESLKRLYNKNSEFLPKEKLDELLENNKINQEEYNYIIEVM